MEDFVLTTVDNPYDPFTEFVLWFQYDELMGYHTCGYLDRIAKTSDHFTDEQNEQIIEDAIDEIIKHDFRNIYRKVTKKDYEKNRLKPNKITENF